MLDQYIGPDWVDTILEDGKKLIGLIKIDYPSPFYDAKELQRMSRGEYIFNKVYSLDGTAFINTDAIEEYMDDFLYILSPPTTTALK